MHARIKKIQRLIASQQLDGLLLSSTANISYLTGFKSRDAYALVSKKGNVYFTDSRYTEEVKPLLKDFSLTDIHGPVFSRIADCCADLGLGRIGFESRLLPYAEYSAIKDALPESSSLLPTHSIIEQCRMIKEPRELADIRTAVQLTVNALHFIANFITPGTTELEVAAELERFIRYEGASGASFEIIVASGPNSSLPHHLTSQRTIKANEPVVIDMGVDVNGYKSDLTRVFFSGRIDSLTNKIYHIVKNAQRQALQLLKPGVALATIDAACRGYIQKKGFGANFCHNSGHGVGLEVHEEPHVSPKSTQRLLPGMVLTIEPGIYLPHRCGIRIEDMVVITKKGAEILSGTLNK